MVKNSFLIKLSIILMAFQLLYLSGTAGFSVPTATVLTPKLPILSPVTSQVRTTITKLHSSNSPTESIEAQSRTKEKDVKDKLIKLYEKQRQELLATEELLQGLQKSSCGGNTTSPLTESISSGINYGFISRSEGCRFENVDDLANETFTAYGPPANIFSLGKQQFIRNLDAIKGEYKDEENMKLAPKQKRLQAELKNLTLNSTAIWEREESRGEIVAPLVIKLPYYVLCYFLDVVFEGRYVFSRFFLLETVARMPYFSYITMLHLYETLGFWRRSSDVKRVHFAEEWNEFHHLLVMESLGGDQAWWVRFVAQHSAIVYFLVLTHLFALSPSLSYKFSEMLETHAVDTYGQFLDENEAALKELPPSLAALDYYTLGISDPMFGEYQTAVIATGGEIRKPGKDMKSLYDVFKAIRADEGDHVGTMKACLDPSVPVLSPALESRVLTGFALAATIGYIVTTGGELPNDISSANILEGLDDSIIGDTVFDGIFGGIVALIGGLKDFFQGDTELAEIISEDTVENLATDGEIVAAFWTSIRQGLTFLLEAIGSLF